MSNSLDPDQARHFVGPDLDPNCLQRLSADDESSRQRVKFTIEGKVNPVKYVLDMLCNKKALYPTRHYTYIYISHGNLNHKWLEDIKYLLPSNFTDQILPDKSKQQYWHYYINPFPTIHDNCNL